MFRRLSTLVLLFALLLCAVDTLPSNARESGFNARTLDEHLLGWKEIDNIPYVKGATESQTLDLLIPEHNRHELLPVVVYIHGGGWYQGDKRLSPARVLVNFGFVVASINYRLTTQARFPAQIEDCTAALDWLKKNGARYGLDANRMGVWGMSAGGHLAALIGTEETATAHGAGSARAPVRAVVDWFGPTNFMEFVDLSSLNSIAAKALNGLFGGAPSEHPKEAVAASPITYVQAGVPPFLIMHGDHDNIVPLQQSEEFYESLKKVGANATLVVVPGAGHEMFGPKYVEQVVSFFRSNL